MVSLPPFWKQLNWMQAISGLQLAKQAASRCAQLVSAEEISYLKRCPQPKHEEDVHDMMPGKLSGGVTMSTSKLPRGSLTILQ